VSPTRSAVSCFKKETARLVPRVRALQPTCGWGVSLLILPRAVFSFPLDPKAVCSFRAPLSKLLSPCCVSISWPNSGPRLCANWLSWILIASRLRNTFNKDQGMPVPSSPLTHFPPIRMTSTLLSVADYPPVRWYFRISPRWPSLTFPSFSGSRSLPVRGWRCANEVST